MFPLRKLLNLNPIATASFMLTLSTLQPKIATVSRTSEKALKKQIFISLIKMWIFEKINKEKNMEKTEKVNQYFC